MCIIVVKPKGVALPTTEELSNMNRNNPDGFGLAYSFPGSNADVRIVKGSMSWRGIRRVINRVPRPLESNMILHFRITSRGDTSPENCHPFPLSRKVGKLRARQTYTPMAVAHNGTITEVKPGGRLSDTQLFIRDYLSTFSPSMIHRNKALRIMIAGFTKDKFVFLSKWGFRTVGEFHEHNGCWYSGYSYSFKDGAISRSAVSSTEYGYGHACGYKRTEVNRLGGVLGGSTVSYMGQSLYGVTNSLAMPCGVCPVHNNILYYYQGTKFCLECRKAIVELEHSLNKAGKEVTEDDYDDAFLGY